MCNVAEQTARKIVAVGMIKKFALKNNLIQGLKEDGFSAILFVFKNSRSPL